MSEALPNLLWVDVETTGLSATEDALLEIAVVVTDADLAELFADSWVLYQDIHLNQIDEWPRKTHMANGLFEDVLTIGTDIHDVEDDLDRLMNSSELWPIGSTHPPLCGSSVKFDRDWLAIWFPRFSSKIHYRTIDVSSIKELMLRWDPRNAIEHKDSQHRALPDIRDSIAELRFYRSQLWHQPSLVSLV